MGWFMKSFFLKIISICLVFSFWSVSDVHAKPKALKPAPKKVEVIVQNVPDGQVSLVVPLTFDKTIVEITEAMSNVSGGLTVFGQDGVGVIQTNGSLPSQINLSLTFKGLKRGKTNIAAGVVVDKLGGTPIEGATAKTGAKKIKVK